MADHQTARYRNDDPYGRAHGGVESNDPLAELARLIGQNDPFADIGRGSRGSAQPHNDTTARYADENYGEEPAYQPSYGQEPGYEQAQPQGYAYEQNYTQWQDAQPEPSRPPAYDPHAEPVHQEPLPTERHYEANVYGAHGYDYSAHQDQLQQDNQPGFADPQGHLPVGGQAYEQPAYDPAGYPAQSHGYDQQPQDFDAYQQQHGAEQQHAAQAPQQPYQAGYDFLAGVEPQQLGADTPPFPSSAPPFHRANGEAPGDDFYDDASSGRRRSMVAVMAVLALAVLGTAGAYGYRSIFGGSSSSTSATPPVIRASTEPTKVAPPPAPVDPANKLSYERFGDRTQNEQVVVREEQPLEPRDFTRSTPPRVVLPGAPNAAAPATAQASANPPSVLTEPKRVRTVPIRPDQEAPQAPARSAAVPVAPANAPLDVSPQASAAMTPAAPARSAVAARAAAPRTTPTQVATANPNAPLSLAPDAGSPAPAAAPAAPARISAPARAATASNGSGYLVQVSSQRSEADAQSSFRSLQSKYGSVLGDRQPVIRRADLGEKGTYYRAMVGPFSSRDQAVQLCGSLKAAGGNCIVQGN